MTEQNNNTAVAAPAAKTAGASVPQRPQDGRGAAPQQRGGYRGGAGQQRGGRPRRDNPRDRAQRSEFDNKIIQIRRVARVVAGGRRFSFSVAIVLGDKKGRVGVGLGKAGDTALAIEKATRAAKRSMITVELTETKSLPHDVSAKYCASVIEIRPAKGRGLIAGSSIRTVLALAGITDVTAKVLSRSHNQLNNARSAIRALGSLKK
jgi:small subunit ribosomal protein S5